MARTSPAMTNASSKPPAVMLRLEIEGGPERHDAAWIDVQHAHVIVPLDVIHVHGRGDAGPLIKIAQIIRQVRIIRDAAQIALEVADIDRIEAHQRGEQSPVRLGDARSAEIALA